MDYYKKGSDIVLRQKDLDLGQTLDCGQAFRWEKAGDDTYTGFFLRKALTVSQKDDIFTFRNTTEEEFLGVWADYFDLDRDYGELKERFSEDETMRKACGYAPGIRLLRQDAFECAVSFVISQNNNIPRIKGIIGRLCERFGGFPEKEQLYGMDADDFAFLRAGFRGKYLADLCSRLESGETDIDAISSMPTDEARKELMKVKGIGPKVADCIMLFGMDKCDAFPKDVWIKRVMAEYYPQGMPLCTKGCEGIAQQYLFHYIRTGIKKDGSL